jgi:hypothetical protein
MDMTIEQGHSLDLSWSVPGLRPDGDTGITLDFQASSASFTHPDGSVEQLSIGTNVALVNRQDVADMTAEINVSDTTRFDVGDVGYHVRFVNKTGEVMLEDSGVITVTPFVAEPAMRVVRPWDLLNPNEARSSEELKAERLAICHPCENYKVGLCVACGCVLTWKTSLVRAACPIGKW